MSIYNLKILKSYSVNRFSLTLFLTSSCAVELSVYHTVRLCDYCLIHELPLLYQTTLYKSQFKTQGLTCFPFSFSTPMLILISGIYLITAQLSITEFVYVQHQCYTVFVYGHWKSVPFNCAHIQAHTYTHLLEIWIASLELKQTGHHLFVKRRRGFEGLPLQLLIFLCSQR